MCVTLTTNKAKLYRFRKPTFDSDPPHAKTKNRQCYRKASSVEKMQFLTLFLFAFCLFFVDESEQREFGGIRSDVIVTKFGPEKPTAVYQDANEDDEEPGWMVSRCSMNFSKIFF